MNYKVEKSKRKKIVLVPHFASHPFWVPTINGMEDAVTQFNVKCEWIGPQDYDIQGQVDTIEHSLKTGVDGIAFSRPDPSAFNEVSQMAIDLGIPVVIFNTNLPDAEPQLPFVGADDFQAGQVLANQMIKYLPDGGKVAICTPSPDHSGLEKRVAGFMDVMYYKPEYEVVGPFNITFKEGNQVSAHDATLLSHPNLKGIVTVCSDTDVLAKWIAKNNLKDKIVAGGYDVLPGTIEGIKNGYIKFAIVQNPYLQGFMPVAMFWWNLAKTVPLIDINTGSSVVDSSNIEFFNSK